MNLNIKDASNYFKGLLLLIRKDRQITQPEIEVIKSVGTFLGFEKEFCDNAISEILKNTYIEDVPPVFSTKELAIKFLKDGVYLAFVDHEEIHPGEQQWLQSIAEKNGLDLEFLSQEIKNVRNKKGDPSRLEVFELTTEYS